MNILKDYRASDIRVQVTPEGATLLLLTTEGWVGVTLPLQVLAALRDQIPDKLPAGRGREPRG